MTNLKEVHGLNIYCGPAVLSALTGKSTDECAAVISAITGQTVIKAVAMHDITRALNRLRFDTIKVETIARTLYGTLLRLSSMDGFYIVAVPKHVVAIEVKAGRIYLIDNHTKEPLLASSSSRLMQSVDGAWKVIPKRVPVLVKTSIKVVKFSHNNDVQIQRLNLYEDKNDDTLVKLGQFTFSDIIELNNIIEELKLLADLM
jgi:hypothetical protein